MYVCMTIILINSMPTLKPDMVNSRVKTYKPLLYINIYKNYYQCK